MRLFLSIALAFLLAAPAVAWPGRNYTYTNNYAPSYDPSLGVGSDQERCQSEAEYMASRGIAGHVGGLIGRFEGVGFGNSPNCNTCTPGSGMRLTGDACAQGRNGMWYRVRSWR